MTDQTEPEKAPARSPLAERLVRSVREQLHIPVPDIDVDVEFPTGEFEFDDRVDDAEPRLFSDCDTVDELLGQLAGAASTCWEHIAAAGVFESSRATQYVDAAIERLGEIRRAEMLAATDDLFAPVAPPSWPLENLGPHTQVGVMPVTAILGPMRDAIVQLSEKVDSLIEELRLVADYARADARIYAIEHATGPKRDAALRLIRGL